MSENDRSTASARASVTAVAGVLAAVGLLLVMLTWAATIGPEEIVAGGKEPSYTQLSPTTVDNADNADNGADLRDSDRPRHELVWMILTITVIGLAIVMMLALLLNLLWWLLTRNWRVSRRERDPDEIAFEPLGTPALARALSEGARAQRQLLDEGTPRNAIVSCWHRFEQHAAAAGIDRARWETSSEFTLRVLDELSADPAAVTELADLYRDARHSAHEITEEARARARAALDRILDSLHVPTGAS